MKHTAEEWIVDTESDGQLWITTEGDTVPICKINQEETEAGDILVSETDKANARLIATAPELLGIVQDFVKGMSVSKVYNSDLWDKAQKLINKATT